MPDPQVKALSDFARANGIGPNASANATAKIALPPIENLVNSLQEELEEPKVLVEGLIHAGTKISLAGNSKANKTWTLLDLGLSVAAGIQWWGLPTTQGKVLYINFEIPRVFMLKRVAKVLEAKGIAAPALFSFWHLRGRCCSADEIVPQIIQGMQDDAYSLVIVDPIYKLMGGRDENSAGDIANLLNQLEKIAVDTGAAVIFGSHFSKGNQAAKEVLDRVSGSGVFARDPDTILTLTRHVEEDAFVVEPVLRNFPPMPPFTVRWEFPLMHRALDLNPGELKQPRRGNAKAKGIPSLEEFVQIFPATYKGDPGQALLTMEQVSREFTRRGWDKGTIKTLRDEAIGQGLLQLRRGGHNKFQIGQPNIFQALDDHEQIGTFE